MAYYDPPTLLTPDSGTPAYTSRHTRSKSYSHRTQVTGPPPSYLGAPMTGSKYLAAANEPPQTPTVAGTIPLYRRHSKKKSSQILVEPMGAQHQINYMPMSPTVAIPQGLENIIQPPPMTPVFPHQQHQQSHLNQGNSLTVHTTGHAGLHHQPGMLSPTSASNASGSRYLPYGSSPPNPSHLSTYHDPPSSLQLNRHTSLKINPTATSLSSSPPSSTSPSSFSYPSVPTTPSSAVEQPPLVSVETASLSQPQQPYMGPPLPFPTLDGSVSPSASIKNAPVSRSSSSSSALRKVHGHNRTISMGEFDRHSRYTPSSSLPPFPAYPESSPSPAASLKSPTVAPLTISGTTAVATPSVSSTGVGTDAAPSNLSNSSFGPPTTNSVTTTTDSGIPGAVYLPTNFQKPRTHSNASSKSLVSGSASPISLHSSLASSPIVPSAPPIDDKPLSRSSSISSTNLEHHQPVNHTATAPPSSSFSSSPSPPSPTSNKFSANTLTSGASVLIAGQFFSKLVTFSLNQLIFRFVGPEIIGANSQLELLVSTVLFFSREAIRLATQRQTLVGKRPDVYRFEGGVVENTISGTVQEVINIGFLPVLMGIPLAAILSFTYLHYNNTPDDSRTISIAVAIFALAAIIELASEPAFLLFQLKLQFKKRASFESIAVTCRCILTFFISLVDHRNNVSNSIMAFAVGQLAYASVLTSLYIFEGLKEAHAGQYELTYPRPIWKDVVTPEKTTAEMLKNGSCRAAVTTTTSSTVSVGQETKTYFNASTTKLATSIWLQTVFKHCLTEGDRFLVSLFLPIADQGVYAVVVNYGSLLARLVFLPIEEALRNFFSKILSNDTENISAADMELSILVLSTLLRFYSYLSLFAIAFGPVVAAYLLQFLVSKVWYTQTDAAIVLATYACYIPFLAMNGALEAFVQSVATPADIKHQSSVMLIFSLSFSAAAYLLMRPFGLGAQGLVLANMFNMAQRIGWCIMWIESYYKKLRENSKDVAAAAVEAKQKISEEKKKEEPSTKEKEGPAEAKSTGTDAQTSANSRKRKNTTSEKEDTHDKNEQEETEKKDNKDDEDTKEKTAPSNPTPEKCAQQVASHRALAYSPWGWLRLAMPSLVVLASFILLILPVSWLLIGRAAQLSHFAQQVALAVVLAIVIAGAERELLLGAGRNLWAKVSSQRRKLRAKNKD